MHDLIPTLAILIPIFGIVIGIGGPVVVIIVLARYWHMRKMEMIRRGTNHTIYTPVYPGAKSLLWGLLLSFLGIAALISTYFHSDTDFLNFGLLILGAGLALLVYWKLTAPERERMRRLIEERFPAKKTSSQKTTPQPSCPETESHAPEGSGQAM
ncbi:MAG: DUF6249 domain-containing protein [Candidatus Latescibacterota bacterium]